MIARNAGAGFKQQEGNLAHKEACQVFIEQEIKEGLAQGKTPYSIGKDLSAWVEQLFETNIPATTIEKRAERIKFPTNVGIPPTPGNPSEILDNQVPDVKHGGKREGAGPPLKYQKCHKPYSEALGVAVFVITHLESILDNDPKRVEALKKVMEWIKDQLKEDH